MIPAKKKYLSRCCQIPRDFLQDPAMNESPKVCMPTFEFHSLKYRIYRKHTDRSEQCKPRRESTTHPALFRHNRYLIVQIQILECVVRSVFKYLTVYTVTAFSYIFFYLGITSLSTIFQSYRDGVWMLQGAQRSLLECCLTEISRLRHRT